MSTFTDLMGLTDSESEDEWVHVMHYSKPVSPAKVAAEPAKTSAEKMYALHGHIPRLKAIYLVPASGMNRNVPRRGSAAYLTDFALHDRAPVEVWGPHSGEVYLQICADCVAFRRSHKETGSSVGLCEKHAKIDKEQSGLCWHGVPGCLCRDVEHVRRLVDLSLDAVGEDVQNEWKNRGVRIFDMRMDKVVKCHA